MEQDQRLPATGQAWRHYKGGLYTVVGLARDENGFVQVVYTNFRSYVPDLYTQRLERFLQEVENAKPRFKYERPAGGDEFCPFIR